MATLRIEHAIHDYDLWLKAFDSFEQARTKAGVRSFAIRQPVDDPKYLMLDLEFDTQGQAESFADFLHDRVWSSPTSSPALAGRPQTRILDLRRKGELPLTGNCGAKMGDGSRVIRTERQREEAMTEHPDVELARRAYEAMAKGDLATVSEGIADDVTWHGLAAGPLSGTYHGRDEVLAFFGRLAEETAGTFRLEVHDVLANDEHTVVLCTMSASRGNKSIEIPVVNVAHVRDGKVTELWGATTDPQASIAFWS